MFISVFDKFATNVTDAHSNTYIVIVSSLNIIIVGHYLYDKHLLFVYYPPQFVCGDLPDPSKCRSSFHLHTLQYSLHTEPNGMEG